MTQSVEDPPAVVMDSTIALMALMKVKGVGRRGALRLIVHCAKGMNPTSLHEALVGVRGLGNVAHQIYDSWPHATDQFYEHTEMGIRPVGFFDDAYPARLRAIPDPPAVLFVKGNSAGLHAPKALAVVGTREPTAFGATVARRSAASASAAGFVIVSGLAHGCDTFGHEGCLEADGTGVVVLAQGLDRVYPAANRQLADRLLDGGGCLVSEYPVGTAPVRAAFVERDRIQSGLSDAVLVIETDVRGGTMHTVRFCLEQGRALACIDHPPSWRAEEKTQGNQKLIAERVAVPIADGEALRGFLESIKHAQPEDQPSRLEPQASLAFDS